METSSKIIEQRSTSHNGGAPICGWGCVRPADWPDNHLHSKPTLIIIATRRLLQQTHTPPPMPCHAMPCHHSHPVRWKWKSYIVCICMYVPTLYHPSHLFIYCLAYATYANLMPADHSQRPVGMPCLVSSHSLPQTACIDISITCITCRRFDCCFSGKLNGFNPC